MLAAVVGGMDPQQAIIAGGGALPADSNGYPWNGRYVMASGNLLADFHANVAAEAQSRLQTARLYTMTDDPGVKETLQFNLARDTAHQNQWLAAIEQLREDGVADTVEDSLSEVEYAEHAATLWHLSDGSASQDGQWASGPTPDGRHEFEFVERPQPLRGPVTAPPARSVVVRDVPGAGAQPAPGG